MVNKITTKKPTKTEVKKKIQDINSQRDDLKKQISDANISTDNSTDAEDIQDTHDNTHLKPSDFQVRSTVLHVSLGVTKKTLNEWTAKFGLKKVSNGIYDLREALPFWRDRILKPSSTLDVKLAATKERQLEAKARMAEITLAKMEDKLIEKDAVVEAWCSRIAEFGNACKALKYRLPPVCAGKSIAEMRVIIDAELDALFANFKRTGKFCETKHGK